MCSGETINYSLASTPELSSGLCYYYRPMVSCQTGRRVKGQGGGGQQGGTLLSHSDHKLWREGVLRELSASCLQLPQLSHTHPSPPACDNAVMWFLVIFLWHPVCPASVPAAVSPVLLPPLLFLPQSPVEEVTGYCNRYSGSVRANAELC